MPMRQALTRVAEQFEVSSRAVALNLPFVGLLLWFNLRRLPLDAGSWGYLLATILGYYQLPLLLMALLLCLVLALAPRVLRFGVGVLLTAYVYYLLVDCVTYRICKLHIDLFWIEYVLRDYTGLGLPPTTLLAAAVALAIVAAFEWKVLKRAQRRHAGGRRGALIIVVALLAFGVSQARHIVAYDRNDDRITRLTPYLPFYMPFTSHRNADKVGSLLDLPEDSALNAAPPAANAALRFPTRDLEYGVLGGGTPPNVVMILLECWRHDMMNATVTPNIAAFAERATVFDNHLSSGNSTTSGLFGLFYGLHPTYWTAVKAHSNAIRNPPLIDAMTDRGYAFGVFADSKFERHKIKDTVFRDIEVHESFVGNDDAERDGSMARQVMAFIDERAESPEPTMLFAFFKASHTGYRYPPDHAPFRPTRRLNPAIADGADAGLYLNDYRNALHYDDELVGGILRHIEQRGLLENTIVIITSDHGESFDDNHTNDWGHGSNFTRSQVQVPLVFYAPERHPERIAYRTSHVDIAPTLLQNVFGCVNEVRDYSNGRNLFAAPAGTRAFVVGSYVNHAYVLGEDVFAIFPMYLQKYKFDDVRVPAAPPTSQALVEIVEETTRFYAPNR